MLACFICLVCYLNEQLSYKYITEIVISETHETHIII